MSDSPVDPQGEDGHKEDSMKTISESEGELSDVNVEMQEMSPEDGADSSDSQHKLMPGSDSQAYELNLSAGTAASQQREAYGGGGGFV
mmetsp:Transcript_4685/g.11013  ORF Transcript_4685/g.11013 Transcript_4685/m.11013 type:complete len:88 (-) Transcript_4685:7-270(-)